MKTCYIVAAAELAEERLRPEEGDLVIAADAGLRHLARLRYSRTSHSATSTPSDMCLRRPAWRSAPCARTTRTPWPR